MKICIVCGARPNFIKVAPLIRAIETEKKKGTDIDYSLVYAGSEDDPSLEPSLFSDLSISKPDVYLGVTCANLNELTGHVMAEFERYIRNHPADVVVVVDDLASTMAVSIVAKKQGITLAHLAAGTRSFDITMPKEINRLVIDGLSDLLFTAGISNNSIANREGAELSKVYMVGNILIDNLRFNRDRFVRPEEFKHLGITDGNYILFTINRKVLMADKDKLFTLLDALVRSVGDVPIVAPLREKAVETIMSLGLHKGLNLHNFHIVSSLSYLEFGYATARAKGIVTDSGNVAEEATFWSVPCVTLNSYTEHIETVKVGTNELVGEDPQKLSEAMKRIIGGQWKHGGLPDRWDGRSAERILSTLLSLKRK